MVYECPNDKMGQDCSEKVKQKISNKSCEMVVVIKKVAEKKGL